MFTYAGADFGEQPDSVARAEEGECESSKEAPDESIVCMDLSRPGGIVFSTSTVHNTV